MAVLIMDVTRRKSKPSTEFEHSNPATKGPQTYTTVTDRAGIQKGTVKYYYVNVGRVGQSV